MPKEFQEDFEEEENITHDFRSVKALRWKPHYAYEYDKCFDVDGFGGPLEYKIYSEARDATKSFRSGTGFWISLGWLRCR